MRFSNLLDMLSMMDELEAEGVPMRVRLEEANFRLNAPRDPRDQGSLSEVYARASACGGIYRMGEPMSCAT